MFADEAVKALAWMEEEMEDRVVVAASEERGFEEERRREGEKEEQEGLAASRRKAGLRGIFSGSNQLQLSLLLSKGGVRGNGQRNGSMPCRSNEGRRVCVIVPRSCHVP